MVQVEPSHKDHLHRHHQIPVTAEAAVVYIHNYHKHQAPRVHQVLRMVQMFHLHRSLAQIQATQTQVIPAQAIQANHIQILVTRAQTTQVQAIQAQAIQVSQILIQIIILATIPMVAIATHNQTHTIPMVIGTETHPVAEILTPTKTKTTIQDHSVIYSGWFFCRFENFFAFEKIDLLLFFIKLEKKLKTKPKPKPEKWRKILLFLFLLNSLNGKNSAISSEAAAAAVVAEVLVMAVVGAQADLAMEISLQRWPVAEAVVVAAAAAVQVKISQLVQHCFWKIA